MRIPNFMLIGAAKAGTTSLYHYLKQHPEVYMPSKKEPRFFAPEFYTTYCNGPLRSRSRRPALTLEEYQHLFKSATDEKVMGEASTEYLYFPDVPTRIKRAIPHVKLIAILRDPSERAFSAFCYQVRDGCETLSFEEALKDEERRVKEYWRPGSLYKQCGFYYDQLKRYFDIFEQAQIKVYLYEDLKADAQAVSQDIFRFLEIDDKFIPNLSRKNVSKLPKSLFLNKLLVKENLVKSVLKRTLPESLQQNLSQTIKQHNLSSKPILATTIRESLIQLYKEDIIKLEELIQRDLAHWLK